MGTSVRWPGPGGNSGIAAEWKRVSKKASDWRPERPDALRRLEEIADDHLRVLHRTMRDDPDAFGLYEAAHAAGERLTEAMAEFATAESVGDEAMARFVALVGGEGGTVAEAAVRRAAAVTIRRVAQTPAGAAGGGWGGGLFGDLFCPIFRWLFADIVAEFLRAAIAEKITLLAPALPAVDPENHIATWLAERVYALVPSPCEEAERLGGAAAAAEAAETVEDPAGALTGIARDLLPVAVGRALGLSADGDGDAGPVAA
ncbi:hypothetical protein AB0H03_20705 [Streptomyces sparsogenes]|uniref:hypothetical protein n=1 Tax=Streptomyces sparsogenes TaxID=67365 RepID=UPI00340C1598